MDERTIELLCGLKQSLLEDDRKDGLSDSQQDLLVAIEKLLKEHPPAKPKEIRTNVTEKEMLDMLAWAEFSLMSAAEREGFQGCESANPLIGYLERDGEDYTIIIDGHVINIIQDGDMGGGQIFELKEVTAA